MDAIYDTIENDYKIGLFESATGTGKTLSIICSTMTWLRNFKKKNTFEESKNASEEDEEEEDDDEPDWVQDEYQKSIVNKTKDKLREFEVHLDEVEKEYKSRKRQELKIKDKIKRRKQTSLEKDNDDDSQFLPNDFNENSTAELKNFQINQEINKLMKIAEQNIPIDEITNCPTKIYFSSRTHTQLNQFSSQLRLTTFDASFDEMKVRTKYLPLGSRKQLCINEKINKQINKSGDQMINDACIDLQKSKDGCSYLSKNDSSLAKEFSDLSLAKIRDIEELADLGSDLKICPYYSARESVDATEIISLPYQLLFQKSTRNIWNLNIKDSIVIIDEAHNIIDTITSLYSVKITSKQLDHVIKSLNFYLKKFVKRLNSNNRIQIMKLVKICKILINFINQNSNLNLGEEVKVDEIFTDSTGDLVNIHKLDDFLTKTKLAYKIESYMSKIDESYKNSSSPLLFEIIKFLKCFTNPSKEGKFFWDKSNNEVSLNYMLLDPSFIFKEIVDQAKCVLLCGGTMEPMSEFIDYLFPFVPESKINKFSCGHIIPDENLKVFAIDRFNGEEFEFSFNRRSDLMQLENLGNFILEVCKNVPYGVVVFFSSYKFLEQVLECWQKTAIYSQIANEKQIFQEPSNSSKIDHVLNDYSNVINIQRKGAILFSVVGGKLSEGINFSNDLARAVLMIGLPYPNAFSGEIISKRKYIESQVLVNGGTLESAKQKSSDYYENLCMKAVNQSIGRSIRHANDYSLIYLVDKRFKFSKIQNKLSKWVKDRLINASANIMEESREFFEFKNFGQHMHASDNEQKLTGRHESAFGDTFSSGVANGGASVKIPRQVAKERYGNFEDGRLASNTDSYLVTGILVETICGSNLVSIWLKTLQEKLQMKKV
ncbi:CHL1 [Candida jiufengensis]|uniref:CHL1 n=1 Tax=Candida jiufengensis TaxID=497108 RepID=UPI0022259B17|nr:CHL1 [Candida jiufengensis]KAI5952004.1 CHL1 [Candida jiufengensis]